MYLFFDTETTGLPIRYNAPLERLNNWPRLVQLAWLIYDDNEQCVDERKYIIRPNGFIIPERAAKIHGITTERALRDGVDIVPILKEFSISIEKTDVVVAHNIDFDEKIIGSEFIRYNIEHGLFNTKRICTMRSSTNYCKIPNNYGKYKWPNLKELHQKLFKCDFPNAHDALEDVRACAKSFFELKRLNIV